MSPEGIGTTYRLVLKRLKKNNLNVIAAKQTRKASTGRCFLLCFAVFSIFTLMSCASVPPQESVMSRKKAAQIVLDKVVPLIHFDKHLGLRVNQYPMLLPKNSQISAALPRIGGGEHILAFTFPNPCWLHMIDKDPDAHFAHPVEIVPVDAITGEVNSIKAEWWPEVDGSPVFNTLEIRTDPEQTILDRPATSNLMHGKEGSVQNPGPKKKCPSPDFLPLHPVIVRNSCPGSKACHTWAIIVCGFLDLKDTFHIDTNGMYEVLLGLGVPDDNIFYVSPHTTDPGVDRIVSVDNVEWAIEQVAASSKSTDRVLFFYSSHGEEDFLICNAESNYNKKFSASQLAGWLGGIKSANLTIVIEACHSGSLIGRHEDGRYVAAEDDLTGHGERNRIVFTSAPTESSSYGNLRCVGDPDPYHKGSESIWGFVEAFTTVSADSNHDGDISVGEAHQFAWDTDESRIKKGNVSQWRCTGPVPIITFNYCQRTRPKILEQNES
jgi:hypothetical protein